MIDATLAAIYVFGATVFSIFAFLIGRLYAESEKIISEKRRVYESHLKSLPPISMIGKVVPDKDLRDLWLQETRERPVLLFYASPTVAKASGVFIQNYCLALERWQGDDSLSEEMKNLLRSQNDLIVEMRRDAFGWSVFDHSGKSRVK